jgi:hypothetical protein
VNRGSLRHRVFRLLFARHAVSSLGDRLVPVALAFDGASFLIGAGCLAAMRLAPLVLAARTTVLGELRAGWPGRRAGPGHVL